MMFLWKPHTGSAGFEPIVPRPFLLLISELNQDNLSKHIQKKIREDRMNIGNSRACISILDTSYAN